MKKIILITLLFCYNEINASDTLNISKWKQLNIPNSNVILCYPDFILQLDSITNKNSKIFLLKHSIKYKHTDFCDLKDNVSNMLDNISDLSFAVQAFNTNLITTLQKVLGSDFTKKYFFNDSLKTEKGFISKITIGKLFGYVIQEGAEGCGLGYFVFPMNKQSTLVFTLNFVNGYVIINNQNIELSYEFVKGLMLPELAGKIFSGILKTIK